MIVGVAGSLAAGVLVAWGARQPARDRVVGVGFRGSEGTELAAAFGRVLDGAGIALAPREAMARVIAAAMVAAALGASAFSVGGAATGVAAVVAGTGVYVERRRRAYERAVARAVPTLLEALARSLRGGAGLTEAVQDASRQASGPAADHARSIERRLRVGLGVAEAAAAWAAERSGTPASRDAMVGASAIRVASTGGRAAAALEGVAAALRDAHAVADEARALSAQGRLSAVVVGLLPPAALAGSALLDADAVGLLIHHPVGRWLLCAGLASEALGVWWMSRIVRVDS